MSDLRPQLLDHLEDHINDREDYDTTTQHRAEWALDGVLDWIQSHVVDLATEGYETSEGISDAGMSYLTLVDVLGSDESDE